jgi:hypothetical protein
MLDSIPLSLDRKYKKMIENEIWIISGLTLFTMVIFVAYLLYKAGGILKMQEERDLQSNYEFWDSDDY